MAKLTFSIGIELQDNISILCRLKGVTYITIAVHERTIVLGAMGTEYFRIYRTGIITDVEEFSVRVPTKMFVTLNSQGTVSFEILDNILRIQKFVYDKLAAVITAPLELSMNSDMIATVLGSDFSGQGEMMNFGSLTEMREILSLTRIGVQVRDGFAYIDAPAFKVIKVLDSPIPMIVSADCMSTLATYGKNIGEALVYNISGYHVLKTNEMFFGWRESRRFVSTPMEEFAAQVPLCAFFVNMEQCALFVKNIKLETRDKTVPCTLNFSSETLNLDIGGFDKYQLRFSSIVDDVYQDSDTRVETVRIPFDSFKTIMSVNSFNFEHFKITVYELLIALQFGSTLILLRRDD